MAFPTVEEPTLPVQEAEREHTFWHEHGEALLTTHPDQFVAVRDGDVVAVSTSLQQLVMLLREQGLKSTDVWPRFMAATPRRWLL